MLTIAAGIVIAYFVIMFLPLFFEIFGAILDTFLTTDKKESNNLKKDMPPPNTISVPIQNRSSENPVTDIQNDNKSHRTVAPEENKIAELSKQINQIFIFYKSGSMMFNGEFFFDDSTKTKISLVRVTEITLSTNSSLIVEFRRLEGGIDKIVIPMSNIREDCIADTYYLFGLFKKIQ